MSDPKKPDNDPAPSVPPIDLDKVRSQARLEEKASEKERTKSINKIGKDFDCMDLAQKAIDEDKTEAQFKDDVLAYVRSGQGKPRAIAAAGGLSIGEPKTIGGFFVQHDRFKGLDYKVGQRVNCRVEIPKNRFERATLSISGESLVTIQDQPGIVVPDRRMLRIADIIPQGMINAGSMRYVREASYTNAATAVAEGASKPAATLDLEQVTDTVEKIAVTVKVTDEMLADFAATQAYIDNTLAYMVQQLEDTHLLSGSGSSNQIRGILNVTGVQTVAASFGQVPHDAFDKAVENIRNTGNTEPNWMVINPVDWGNLKRTKDSNGQYYGGGPFTAPYGNGGYSNIGNLWGIPVVVTSAISQGTGLVGNFQIGAQILRRTGLTVETTNSNEDDFLKNLVAVRAEQRQLLQTFKPLAFCTVTGIPA